jgi:hypothetical protein
MIKKVVYVGLALILISIVIAVAGSYIGSNSLQGLENQVSRQNLTIAADTFQYLQLNNPNASSLVVIAEHSSAPVNVYLFNSSAFAQWKAAMSSNAVVSGIHDALEFKGKGAFYVFDNSTMALMPYNGTTTYQASQQNATGLSPHPLYYPSSVLLPVGTYYLVIDNGEGSASMSQSVSSKVAYSAPIPEQNVTNLVISPVAKELAFAAAFGTVVFLMFIAGAVITIWGVFKRPAEYGQVGETQKPPEKADAKEMQKYIDKLYSRVGKRSVRSKRAVRKRRTARKRTRRNR